MPDNVRQKGSAVKSREDLPSPREGKAMRSVSPPLSHTPLRRFNYYIALAAAVLLAFYAWRILQWKAQVGGLWNLATGHKPSAAQAAWTTQTSGSAPEPAATRAENPSVEDRINELAQALGVPSRDLAAAIAGAVKEHIPPASLSSVAAHETGDAVRYLVDPSEAASSEAEQPTAPVKKGFQVIGDAVEAMVGLDDPSSDMA
ncbi:hypothetical protein OBBRIDRAFT_794206 [Obba rivulosa]|uniref:Uncharacterized protein n=1 Tax=Obba rivulosa TaxID=1052685 RepID=A0A8E2DIN7_9APHY|nr:hypothetical protein OBBRIDRAFT_794206 [Obba rivulosa]